MERKGQVHPSSGHVTPYYVKCYDRRDMCVGACVCCVLNETLKAVIMHCQWWVRCPNYPLGPDCCISLFPKWYAILHPALTHSWLRHSTFINNLYH